MNIIFDKNTSKNQKIKESVKEFLSKVKTLEKSHSMPIIIFQDGASDSYYIKCSLSAKDAANLCDINAKIDVKNPESYRANRELLLKNDTYLKMENDASNGREFNDIIVEYNMDYNKKTPMKVWGGQHRINAIKEKGANKNRYHGFRIYFNLSKKQRTEIALISNTNISVSNDTFDRMIEETLFGNVLRNWCRNVGFLNNNEDFPDTGSRSEKITVKRARSFIVNFYNGKREGRKTKAGELDNKVYNPYLAASGVTVDPEYKKCIQKNDILKDKALIKAGKNFYDLHHAQYKAVSNPKNKTRNRKTFKNKALVESVITGWSYIAGLLQSHTKRLENHYRIPKTTSKIPDPLNAEDMSEYKHDHDKPTYRGLGTRSSTMDRQRIAQLFLAKSCQSNVVIDKKLMNKAVSQTIGLTVLSKGYK